MPRFGQVRKNARYTFSRQKKHGAAAALRAGVSHGARIQAASAQRENDSAEQLGIKMIITGKITNGADKKGGRDCTKRKKDKERQKKGKKELTRGGKGGNIAYVAPRKQ